MEEGENETRISGRKLKKEEPLKVMVKEKEVEI